MTGLVRIMRLILGISKEIPIKSDSFSMTMFFLVHPIYYAVYEHSPRFR